MNRLRLQEKLQKKKRETSVLEKLDGQRAKLQEEGGATPANLLTYMEALDKYSNRPAFRPLLEQSALHSVLLDSLDDFTKFQQKFVQTTNKKKKNKKKKKKKSSTASNQDTNNSSTLSFTASPSSISSSQSLPSTQAIAASNLLHKDAQDEKKESKTQDNNDDDDNENDNENENEQV